MKVSELKEMLESQDEGAEVFIAFQENWPFEASIRGVATRQDLNEWQGVEELEGLENLSPEEASKWLEEREENLKHAQDKFRETPWKERWGSSEDELPPEEVIIVMGSQTRYTSKDWWSIV